MKKIIILLLIVMFGITNGTVVNAQTKKKVTKEIKVEYVYICNSKTAYVYHSTSSCRGLNRCSHGVVKVTKKEAIDDYGRRACKICE